MSFCLHPKRSNLLTRFPYLVSTILPYLRFPVTFPVSYPVPSPFSYPVCVPKPLPYPLVTSLGSASTLGSVTSPAPRVLLVLVLQFLSLLVTSPPHCRCGAALDLMWLYILLPLLRKSMSPCSYNSYANDVFVEWFVDSEFQICFWLLQLPCPVAILKRIL